MTRFTLLLVVGVVLVGHSFSVSSHLVAADAKGSGIKAGRYTGASQVMIVGRDGAHYDDHPMSICHFAITEDDKLTINFPDKKLGRGRWNELRLPLSGTEPRAVWSAVLDKNTYKATAIPFSPKAYVFRLEIIQGGKLIAGAQQFYAIEPKSPN